MSLKCSTIVESILCKQNERDINIYRLTPNNSPGDY